MILKDLYMSFNMYYKVLHIEIHLVDL